MTSLAAQLIPELENLLDATLELEANFAESIASADPQHQDSARNLLHYLGLRQHDIRDIQHRLGLLGLSRLGRAEAHVCGAIEAVLAALHALAGNAAPPLRASSCPIPSGSMHLKTHAEALLGAQGTTRATRIMVTLPSEAAGDPSIIDGLLGAGMDVMRINCAHDDIDAWLAMIGHLRTAELKHGRRCRIYADLAGPKLRTGNLPSLGGMIEFKARRDTWGQVLQPASIWLTSSEQPEPPAVPVDAVLPISPDLLDKVHAGDHLDVDDTRGNRRHLAVKERFGGAWLAHCFQHAYVRSGANCGLYRDDTLLLSGNVGALPEVIQPLLLKAGDRLRLLHPDRIGGPAEIGAQGEVIRPAAIPCSLAAVFEAAKAGEPIWFDDGKIGGRIDCNDGREIVVEITQAGPNGSKLRPEKGINLPETELAVPAITEDDLRHLGQLAKHIDIIGLSFVRRAEDVLNLHAELERIDAEHLGTVLKIETRQGFENLPHILLASLRWPPVGIMVARGDLAVEIGFERLAEVQEEILWLCEAAHVPVIWATQVLDTMARRGMPSRAEVSDAALSDRAECVMLNKGPFIVDTVRFLDDILTRMNAHRAKGRPMLRKLSVSAIQAVPT